MLINDDKKFIFIAVPRTASGTIRAPFNRPRGKWFTGPTHGTALDARGKYARNKFERYYKFAFVRNPWDRMYSWYCWRRITSPFKKWLMEEQTYLRWQHAPIQKIQQSWFLCDNHKNILVNFIGQFENLRHDYESICKGLRITPEPLETRHKTEHGSYQEVYDDETIDFVAQHHKDDIELFGYTFE